MDLVCADVEVRLEEGIVHVHFMRIRCARAMLP